MFYIVIVVTLLIAMGLGFFATLHVDKEIDRKKY